MIRFFRGRKSSKSRDSLTTNPKNNNNNDSNSKKKREGVLTLYNLLHHSTSDQIWYYINNGLIVKLCSVLWISDPPLA